jgi:hypothetical protein
MLEIPGLYMICSKNLGTFEVARQLSVLAVLVKLRLPSGVLPNYHLFCHVILL